MESIFLCILGVITGAVSALFGIGGGMIIVPCMLYIGYILPDLHFSSHDAVGISVMQMIFSSMFGTYLNIFKKKNIDLKEAGFLGFGGCIGAAFSGLLLTAISSKHLMLIFFIVSCYTFYKFISKSKPKASVVSMSDSKKYAILLIIGSLTGVFAISLGIGGGVLMAPLLAYYLGFDTKRIVALSLFFIACASLIGSISFVAYDVVNDSVIHAGLILGSASLIGVIIGSRLIESISLSLHKRILLSIYLVSICATFNKVLSYYGIILF